MNVAAKVRHEKEQHPERFCSNPRCLWRVKHNGRVDTPCPKHVSVPSWHCAVCHAAKPCFACHPSPAVSQ